MKPLLALIRDNIAAEGPMTLERYMELALQHPEHGYYRHRDPLGAKGDFTTAPEISQMFGELIGLWCAEVWQAMGKPAPFVLLELGPGRGTLLQDMMRATAKIPGFHEAMRLHLLESNAALRETQREKLAAHKPVHLDDLSQLPFRPVLVIANEFFDAMPVHQYVKTESGWREMLVDFQDGKLVFVEGEVLEDFYAEKLIPQIPGKVTPFPTGETPKSQKVFFETSPLSLVLIQKLTAHILRHGGAGLIVDYGYAALTGADTLQALSHHQFADPLENPGEADVTAYVDFIALCRAAEQGGARMAGPIGQGEFLQTLGIELRAAQLSRNASEEQAKSIAADLFRLIDASQMGVMFKVLGIMAPTIKEVPGFP